MTMATLQHGEGPGFPTDDELREQQECFGLAFDVKQEDCVSGCGARDRCILRCVRVEIPERAAQQRLDARLLTAEQVVEVLSLEATISADTAKLYRRVMAGESVASVLPSAPERTDEDVLLEEAEEASDEALEQLSSLAKTPAAQPTGTEQVEEMAKAKKVKGATRKAPKKAELEKMVREKVAKAAKAEVVKAKAKKAKAPAPKAKATKGHKPTAKSAPVPKVPQPMGEKALTAWVRERARSAWVAGLRDGQEFRREFKGKEYVLRVVQKSRLYEVNGKSYPTVYAATAAVVGMHEFPAGKPGGAVTRAMPAWSSQRFWAGGRRKKAAKGKSTKKG